MTLLDRSDTQVGSQPVDAAPGLSQELPSSDNLASDPRALKLKGWSIRAKATALATAFSAIPVLIVGLIAYSSADYSMTERIAREKTSEVEQLSDRVSRFIRDSMADIKTVATIIESSPGVESLFQEEQQRQILQEQLTTLVKNYRVYSNIALYNRDGEVIVQSEGSAPEGNQKENSYFQQVLETGVPALSEPLLAEGTELGVTRSAIYVGVPVKDSEGNTTAVVAARMPIDFLGNAVLRTASLREETTYRLVDSRDRIFQSFGDSESTPLGTPIGQQLSLFSDIKQQQQSLGWIGDTPDGEQLNAYAPVTNVGSLQWSVVSSTNTTIAFAPQRQLLETIALGSAVTALVAAGVGSLLASLATKPIRQAARAVEQLGRGELDTRLAVRGGDELAILGSNINFMARRLQQSLDILEQSAAQLHQQNNVLSQLARDQALLQGDAIAAARSFTEATARTLNLERVSIWLLDDGRSKLTCLDSYVLATAEHARAAEFAIGEHTDYLDALEYQAAIVTEEVTYSGIAFEESAFEEVCALDIPIRMTGVAIGVLRCERRGSNSWQANEQTFAASVANLIALAVENEFLQQEVSHLLDVVSSVGEGDLTTKAKVSNRTTGLVADTFNRLTEDLSSILWQVVEDTTQVSKRTQSLEVMAKDVTTNAEQQADSVTSILALTERAEGAALQSREQIETNNHSLTLAKTTIEQGQDAIASLTQGIATLQQGAERTVQQMKTLGEFVGLADRFVQEQSQIASLTQVLAMNASLVAARAAEQRDPTQFAVVAREFEAIASQVGGLAQQTDTSLKTLEQQTSQIHKVVAAVDADVQAMNELVDGFTAQVERSQGAFAEMSAVMQDVAGAGDAVSQSSLAIVDAARSSAAAMRKIADLAAQTARSSQGTLKQTEQMSRMALQLLEAVGFFRLPDRLDGEADPAQFESATEIEEPIDVVSTPR